MTLSRDYLIIFTPSRWVLEKKLWHFKGEIWHHSTSLQPSGTLAQRVLNQAVITLHFPCLVLLCIWCLSSHSWCWKLYRTGEVPIAGVSGASHRAALTPGWKSAVHGWETITMAKRNNGVNCQKTQLSTKCSGQSKVPQKCSITVRKSVRIEKYAF